MKKILVLILFTIAILTLVYPTYAIYDPLSVLNNRFGIHIIDENDLEDAAKLVNSSGGDWGYVKIVIREDDRKIEKWQEIFDHMRRLHLIPLVRLATRVENGLWVKPRAEDIGSWVDFLNELNWVVENRYVIIFNEPNHAKEWGGEVNPEEYGWYLKEFSSRLKEKSLHFFVLPAGLDASASNSYETMDELKFIKRMTAEDPDVYGYIDGWASHSYPNPAFAGSPYAYGRGSVRTFEWEQSQLSKYGIDELPVFITETGWRYSTGSITPEQVTANFTNAFTFAWNQPQVVTVTPFLLNYQDLLFSDFSWRKIGSTEFQPVYEGIRSLKKTSGQPKQHDEIVINTSTLSQKLIINSDYTLAFEIENKGQSIVSDLEGWDLTVEGPFDESESTIRSQVEPFEKGKIEFQLKTSDQPGDYQYSLILGKNGLEVAKTVVRVTLVPPPSIKAEANLWLGGLATDSDFKVLIYDESETLVHEARDVTFENGSSIIEGLYDVVPGKRHRIVLSRPYYLPRQEYATLSESQTDINFRPLLPLDPTNDGALTFEDIQLFLSRPRETIQKLNNARE